MHTLLNADLLQRSNLTKSQLLIWTGQQLSPRAPLYNMAVTFRFNVTVNLSIFEQAVQQLVDRCDALRTVIELIDGIPQQRVVPAIRCEMNVLDFSNEPDPNTALRRWTKRRCQLLLDT